jgi:hypothetical protein
MGKEKELILKHVKFTFMLRRILLDLRGIK